MDKTYVFDNNGSECGNNGMMGLIASLCQNRGLDPNMVMAMMNKNGNGFGGEGGWFMWVIFLFFLMGWGGGGFGFGGRGGQSEGNFLANQLDNATGRELLQQAIAGNGQAISQLASTLSCDVTAIQGALNGLQQQICSVGNQVGLSGQQVIAAINQGNCQLATQLSNCCCDIKDAITRGNYENQLATVQQTNTLQTSINSVATGQERGFSTVAYAQAQQTCELKNAIAAQTQVINDKFCQLEMREMQRENQALRDQLSACRLSDSQAAQTASIVAQLQPVPRPAYIVGSPYQSYGYPYGYPYGYFGNGSYGCNNNCNSCGCGC